MKKPCGVGICIMDYWQRIQSTRNLAAIYAQESLKNKKYSDETLQAFKKLINPQLKSANINIELSLMDIAWQISGVQPTVEELAKAYHPIQSFFLGTVYQDEALDSLNMESSRSLVESLSIPTCIIMGNMLYCEALLSILEDNVKLNINTISEILKSLSRLVHNVMETEIFRRNHIGEILTLEEFFHIWGLLTPNIACIEIGGILGNTDTDKIKLLSEIGSNISILYRINKEISEMYGLRGSIRKKLKSKPPPLPVTLSYELATPSERKELVKTVRRLSLLKNGEMSHVKESKDIQPLVKIVASYDGVLMALKIHRGIIEKTRNLINQLTNLQHKKILTYLLGSNYLSQDVFQELNSAFEEKLKSDR